MPAPEPNPALAAGAPWRGTTVSLGRDGAAVVVTARGEFDVLTTPQLQVAIREALIQTPKVLVLDLTGVTFLASVAIAALVEAREAAGERTELRLAVGHYLDRTLKLIGLGTVFGFYPSTAQALSASDA